MKTHGFTPDLKCSVHINARRLLGDTPPSLYFSHAINSACHDITEAKNLPYAAQQVLGLGGKFIITPPFTTARCHIFDKLERLDRDVALKVHFAGQVGGDLGGSKLFVKSTWIPPVPGLEIDGRLSSFNGELLKLFIKRKAKLNIGKFQQKLLDDIRGDNDHVTAVADKGLGPVRVELTRYIRDALKHLTNRSTYEILSTEQGWEDIRELKREIFGWILKHRRSLSKQEAAYLEKKLEITRLDPFGYFYLLYKLHKTPISTRPVCSDCGSLPHALGQWVDEKLQPIVQAQETYIKDSFTFKTSIASLKLPPNASIFTYDAVSMYTNIDTDECIEALTIFLNRHDIQRRFQHYKPTALVEALKIVMKNNRMKFGDIIVKQVKGIAMGMSPAPTIANLFVAIHEVEKILEHFSPFLFWLKRFIDDGFGIWLHDSDPEVDKVNWNKFKAAVNGGGLQWTFSQRSKTVVFLDMVVEIVDGNLETKIYHKPLALHLFLPPNSCHGPGVTYGLICSMVLRIYSLCSRHCDIMEELTNFFRCLVNRGHQVKSLTPLFSRAISNATRYLAQDPSFRDMKKREKAEANKRRVFLHLPFHPQNPKARVIQDLWRRHVANPSTKVPLNHLHNHLDEPIPIDQLVIAYSRPPNLNNMLSYRKICKRLGPKVSSYVTRHE